MRIKAVSVVCCLETLNSNISLHSFKLCLTSRNATNYKVMENFHEVDQSQESERLKMRIAVLEECVKSFELECKSSRDTELRLNAELDQERRKVASGIAALDSVKLEFGELVVGRKSIETEKETLVERVKASKRVIEAGRRESLCLEKQVKDLEKRLRSSQGETRAAEEKLQTFLKEVASVLHVKSETLVQPTEQDVLNKVESLCNKRLSEVEARLAQVSEHLSEQTELHHRAAQKAELAERQVQDLSHRLHVAETELLNAHVQQDGLKQRKEHYEEFVDRLSESMNIENFTADLGFDMMLKLIQSRVRQLIQQEATALVESRGLTSSLQRKLKAQKDQLESKALHVQLLRKKLTEVGEEKRSRSVEEDTAHQEVKKLQKRIERLQNELRATKLSNTELKAQLSHTNELKLKVTEQSQTVQEQKRRLAQLVVGKARLEKKLSTVDSDLKSEQMKSREELQSLRQSLVQQTERGKELEDFQMLVCQMLGLENIGRVVPKMEIIKLLERHLHTHHHLHHANMPWHCPAHH